LGLAQELGRNEKPRRVTGRMRCINRRTSVKTGSRFNTI
jgi:hypothetical protein